MKFEKYEATGNDFVIIDGFFDKINLSPNEISKICDRHFGIGADGLIIIEPSNEANFFMNFFNSDGQKASMCGNGARASVLFALLHDYLSEKNPKFIAGDGLHFANVFNYDKNGEIEISIIANNVKIKEFDDGIFLNTGVVHFVKIVDNFDFDLKAEGLKISNDSRFLPERTNVDFISLKDDNIFIRTFERGVEDITLSCGTGAVAAAIAASHKSLIDRTINIPVESEGGKLLISFAKNGDLYSDIKLRGAVRKVFNGVIKY